LALIVGMESANQSTVKFSRSVRAKNGIEFLAFTAQWNAVDNKHDKRYLPLVTKIKSGRLRLVREDGMLSFQAADGDQGKFEQLRSYPFTKDDLQTVRVVANTDSPKAAFDVRVSDLRIRMGTPVEQAAAPPVQPDAPGALPANEVQTGNRGWLVAFILIGLTTALLIATAIGLAFYVRMRAAGQAPPKNTPLKN
jgi:hypothetical protein